MPAPRGSMADSVPMSGVNAPGRHAAALTPQPFPAKQR